MDRTRALFILLIACSFLATSCSKLGADYKRPKLELSNSFDETKKDKDLEIEKELKRKKWWKLFQDRTLNQVIEKARKNNYELKQAAARIRQARALNRGAQSELLPGAQVQGSYEKSKNPGSRFPGKDKQGFRYEIYNSSLDASWEIDLFSGLRQELRASTADLRSRKEEREDLRRLLSAEIALYYLNLRGTQEQLKVAEQNIALQEQTLKLVKERQELGLVSELDTLRAETLKRQAEAEVPLLREEIKKNIYQLQILRGGKDRQQDKKLERVAALPKFNGAISIDNPRAMLRRRADVRAVEQKLIAANARSKVAVADLFPKISFDGSLGLEAPNISDLGSSAAQSYIFGPRLIWRPFDTGKLRARIELQEGIEDELIHRYRETVLLAVKDTEKALGRFKAERERLGLINSALTSANKAHKIAKAQYKEGLIDFISLIEAESSVLENRSKLSASKQALSAAIVGIHKALAGGW